MLIQFSVSNYRSFRETETLSMVAAPRLRKKENVFTVDLIDGKIPQLLKVVAIYGPNATGKSNLVSALTAVGELAWREPNARDWLLPFSPFRFDRTLATKPSVFEIHFVHEKVRYRFELAATAERIFVERLSSFAGERELLLYERRRTGDEDIYQFGPQLTEFGKDLLESWQRLTPPRLLFISQAVANSSENLSPLKSPFGWLKRANNILSQGMEAMSSTSRRLAHNDEGEGSSIAKFLRQLDVPVARVRVESAKRSRMGALSLLARSIEPATDQALADEGQTILTHTSALGEADLDFEDESKGTQNLVGFWLPWAIKEDSLGRQPLLVVDEFDSSLHPRIVAALVDRHIKSENTSQLIFTTHDTHLMDAKILRRDQFWLTERDLNGATKLRSVYDFEGRESEDIEKRYYEGRYRGLPLLKR